MQTANYIDNAMREWFEANAELPYDRDRAPDSWQEFGWEGGTHEVPYIGSVRLVSQHGGEGMGDEAWIVVEVTEEDQEPRLFRKEGWHASYSGTEYDGDLVEVRSKVVERTIFEAV